jgi:hypothetical protein
LPPKSSDNPAPESKGVQLERVVALPQARTNSVEGQVVSADYAPRPDTEVVFVLADRKDVEHRVTTNKDGEFRANLSEGNWDVYVKQTGGTTMLQKRIEVGPKTAMVTLLSK